MVKRKCQQYNRVIVDNDALILRDKKKMRIKPAKNKVDDKKISRSVVSNLGILVTSYLPQTKCSCMSAPFAQEKMQRIAASFFLFDLRILY